jgi:cardiolipin synthase A/B
VPLAPAVRVWDGNAVRTDHPFAAVEAIIEGEQLCYVFDPQARLQLLIDAIDGAQSAIQMYYYIYADGKAARWINERLIAALRRGVAVVLLVDGFGTEDQPQSLFDPLIENGAVFARFSPRYGRRYLIRNHQKMLIADRTVAIIGGCNIEDSYFYPTPAGDWWHDMSVRIEGPAATRLAAYFDDFAAWMALEKPLLRALIAILRRHSDTTGNVRWLFSGPFPRLSPLTRMLRHDVLISNQIDMVQAYFTPNWGFLRKLRRLAKRGRFRLITAARSDNDTTIAAARYCYPGLLKRGASIFEYLVSRLHIKLTVTDTAVYAGSANFDMRSLYLNTEIMLRVDDSALAERMRGIVTKHVAQSEEITTKLFKSRTNLLVRAKRLMAFLIITAIDYRLASGLNRNAD